MPHLVYDQKERIGAWVAERVGQGADWGSFYALGVVSGDEVLADIPAQTKSLWEPYRQELRDVTSQSDPFNIVWPTLPQ